MNRILSLLACLPILCSLCLPVFATGEEGETPMDESTPVEEISADPVEHEEYVSIELMDSDREWSAESIPGILVELFGEYTPRTQTVTEYHSDGSEIIYEQIVPGLAGLDWLWIASVGVFSLFMFCVLRALGGCLKWI